MSTQLTKEDKVSIINSHIRTLTFNKYNLEIDILQENAKSTPSESAIANFEEQKTEVLGQITALQAELTKVNALTE